MELKRHLDFISITSMAIKWTFGQDTIYESNKILERRCNRNSDVGDNVMSVSGLLWCWWHTMLKTFSTSNRSIRINNNPNSSPTPKVSSKSVANIDFTTEKFIEHFFNIKETLWTHFEFFQNLKRLLSCH